MQNQNILQGNNNKQKYTFEDERDKIYENNDEYQCIQKVSICCGACMGWTRILLPCICCIFCDNPFIQVRQSYKCIVERFGKPVRVLEAGLHYINPNVDTVKMKNLKTQVIDLPSQKIITKDNINLFIDCVLYYRIISVSRATYKIDDLTHALQNQAIAAIRSVLGEMSLQDLLEKKDEIGDALEELVNAQSQNWGTYVEQIFVKDIQLNKQTQDDMAATAKQKRIGESKLISNKADVEAARLLRETADILDSKAAMQIRYLEVIQNITKYAPEQVIFLPLDSNYKQGANQQQQQQKK